MNPRSSGKPLLSWITGEVVLIGTSRVLQRRENNVYKPDTERRAAQATLWRHEQAVRETNLLMFVCRVFKSDF